jgi:hypothetical protein
MAIGAVERFTQRWGEVSKRDKKHGAPLIRLMSLAVLLASATAVVRSQAAAAPLDCKLDPDLSGDLALELGCVLDNSTDPATGCDTPLFRALQIRIDELKLFAGKGSYIAGYRCNDNKSRAVLSIPRGAFGVRNIVFPDRWSTDDDLRPYYHR